MLEGGGKTRGMQKTTSTRARDLELVSRQKCRSRPVEHPPREGGIWTATKNVRYISQREWQENVREKTRFEDGEHRSALDVLAGIVSRPVPIRRSFQEKRFVANVRRSIGSSRLAEILARLLRNLLIRF